MGNSLTDALAAIDDPTPEQRERETAQIMRLVMDQSHKPPETDLDSLMQAQAAASVYEKSIWMRRGAYKKMGHPLLW